MVAYRTAQGGPVPPCGRGICFSPGAGESRRSGGSDQPPQVLRQAGLGAPQSHRQHDGHRHGDAPPHLR